MATDSPVYNWLQSVFYRLPFMYDLWATATATDRNSGQPDRKSGCLRSIFRSGPVQFPVYMTGLSNTSLQAYTDSDWAADEIKRQSTTGYFATLASGSVCWQSRLQKTVALSSTGAKYMALSHTRWQVVWIVSLFQELGFPMQQIPICADNQGLIFIGSNPVKTEKMTRLGIEPRASWTYTRCSTNWAIRSYLGSILLVHITRHQLL